MEMRSQQTMLRRNAEELADQVLFLKKNRFLDKLHKEFALDNNSFHPVIRQWYRMFGYRLGSDEEHSRIKIKLAVSQWMRAFAKRGENSAFVLQRRGSELCVRYGGGGMISSKAFFEEILPECVMKEERWLPEHPYYYNGIVLGTVAAGELADGIASSDALAESYAAFISLPIPDLEIRRMIEDNERRMQDLQNQKSITRVYGSATRRVEEIPVQNVLQAIGILKEENDFLESGKGSGFVRAVIRFGASSREEYNALAALICSCVSSEDGVNSFEPLRCYPVTGIADTCSDCLAIPGIALYRGNISCRIHAASIQKIDRAASFCTPPLHSCDGFLVRNRSIDENERDIFPAAEAPDGEIIQVGRILGSCQHASVSMQGLLSHTGIFGATNTGKTTTVKTILLECWKKGIPFVVIEGAKKEYASLIGAVPQLKIYTPGVDGSALNFNPLQPEDGVLIETHIAAVVRSLSAVTGGEHPIPEALEGLLKQTYRRFGWKYGMLSYTDALRPFPTFKDAFANVDEYIKNHAHYGPEVRQNLTAALKLRTESMYTGALGRLFADSQGLRAKDFLAAPCVIELSDFSGSSVEFLMNILMFRFQCYLSRFPEEKTLKRLIVIEEAHNIFKKTLTEGSGRDLNNDAFEKMLSEIRASGTGLVLCDQRPSIMPEAVMANTAVKVVHSMESADDCSQIGGPMSLTELQLRSLREFSKGECVISVRGKYGVQHALITPAPMEEDYTATCLICRSRFRCRKHIVRNMLSGMDTDKLALHAAKIESNPYNTQVLVRNITLMFLDLKVAAGDAAGDAIRCCFLGQVLLQYGDHSFQESRIIVKSYADYLERRMK